MLNIGIYAQGCARISQQSNRIMRPSATITHASIKIYLPNSRMFKRISLPNSKMFKVQIKISLPDSRMFKMQIKISLPGSRMFKMHDVRTRQHVVRKRNVS